MSAVWVKAELLEIHDADDGTEHGTLAISYAPGMQMEDVWRMFQGAADGYMKELVSGTE